MTVTYPERPLSSVRQKACSATILHAVSAINEAKAAAIASVTYSF
jgi:hypothetical protein